MQKTLKAGEAAVEVIRFRPDPVLQPDSVVYMALLVKPETKVAPEMVLLKNGKNLEGKYSQYYQQCIRFRLPDDESYMAYWYPIAARLKGIKTVYFSGDYIYHTLNIQGLRNPATGRYVVDELDLRLVTNTKDLVARKKFIRGNKRSGLFGFPAFQAKPGTISDNNTFIPISDDSTQRFFKDGQILPLPGTQAEVNQISVLLQQAGFSTEIFIGIEATENRLKQLANPQILHIATYGFFLGSTSAVLGETHSGKTEPLPIYSNPLFRSGLLLANAQEAMKENGEGVLTAFEAMNLKLDNTELVVLSACETGLGEVAVGEGVYGLQRAFQVAGAGSVMMSLWKVDDDVTRQLMVSFYRNWLQLSESSKRTALQNAQKELKTKYPHPYYWAGFVLVGD